jgi:hypothetical protein
VADFNLDARQEVRLENDRLIAWVSPARGGHIYELDVREGGINLLATLNRRPEVYHADMIAAAQAQRENQERNGSDAHPPDGSNRLTFKQPGLENQLVYDRYPRKAFVDHFYPVDLAVDDLVACREVELGDFVTGTSVARVKRDSERVTLVMERPGRVDGHAIRLKKTIELAAGVPGLSVHYEFDDLPRQGLLHFAVEINLAAMAGHAEDRYYSDRAGIKLGLLDDRLDLPHTSGLTLTDQWLDLGIDLGWSQSASLWCFPIETISQSEGGIERVYQSSAVIPHWHLTPDQQGRWDVVIRLNLDRASAIHQVPKRRLLTVDSPSM